MSNKKRRRTPQRRNRSRSVSEPIKPIRTSLSGHQPSNPPGDKSTERSTRTNDKNLQLNLPASFITGDSRFATLREVLNPSIPTRSLGELTQHELMKLVVHRLRLDKKKFKIRMLGVPGIIDERKAIKEVRALSHIGLYLIDLEKRYLRLLIERG
jgi:hypothetical protein